MGLSIKLVITPIFYKGFTMLTVTTSLVNGQAQSTFSKYSTHYTITKSEKFPGEYSMTIVYKSDTYTSENLKEYTLNQLSTETITISPSNPQAELAFTLFVNPDGSCWTSNLDRPEILKAIHVGVNTLKTYGPAVIVNEVV